MTIDYIPDGAALGSIVRVVGSGFAGTSTVTVGGVAVTFTVDGDTDLTFRLPRTMPTVDPTYHTADIVVDGTLLTAIVVGYAGPWVTPTETIPVTMPGGGGGTYTGLDAAFTPATTDLTFFGYSLDIPTNVALISPEDSTTVAPLHDMHRGLWQSSQITKQWRIAKYLLNNLSLFGPFDYPTDTIGLQYDYPADLMSEIVGPVNLTYTWQSAVYPSSPGGRYAPTADGVDETVEIRLLNDFTTDDPPAQPSPGTLPLITADVLPATTGGVIDVGALLESVGFGAYFHGKGIGVAAVTAYQSAATEPSWPDFGTGKIGYVAVDFLGALTFNWLPPRWRPLYTTPQVPPPLRQFPRDDALGGQPRQGKASRSTQSTARQGWSNTYR